jgi:hypothetical protein
VATAACLPAVWADELEQTPQRGAAVLEKPHATGTEGIPAGGQRSEDGQSDQIDDRF